MGWEDRSYSQGAEYREESAQIRSLIPPRATLLLLGAQFVGWVVFSYLVLGKGVAPTWFVLLGQESHPAAILLHPLAAKGPVQMLVVLLAIWSLAGRVEENSGASRMIAGYLAGNALAGIAFFAFGRLSPALASYELVAPLGAIAAWSATAWQWQRYEALNIFGTEISVRRIVLFGALIVVAVGLVQAGGHGLGGRRGRQSAHRHRLFPFGSARGAAPPHAAGRPPTDSSSRASESTERSAAGGNDRRHRRNPGQDFAQRHHLAL